MKSIIFFVIIMFTGLVEAGGIDLPTISAAQQGTSNSNGAEAADASVLYYNPAGMSYLRGRQSSVSGTLLAFRGKVKDEGSTGTPEPSDNSSEEGRPLGPDGVDPYAAGGSGSFWPKILGLGSAFYTAPYDDTITIGIGVFSPGGGNVNYKSDWSGAYQVDAIALELVNINPSISVKFDDKHSIGFGVSLVGGHLRYSTQLDAKGLQPYLLQQALSNINVNTLTVTPEVQSIINSVCDVPLIVNSICGIKVGDVLPRPIIDALSSPLADVIVDPSSTGSGLIEMYGYGFGYNAGYMYGINEKSRIGLSFRSATKVDLRGRSEWDLDNLKARPVVGTTIVSAINDGGNSDLGKFLGDYLLPETTTKAVFNIPARFSLGYFNEINDKFDVMFDYTFIKSSVMKELSVGFGVEEDSNGNKVALSNATIPLKWRDSYKVSLGSNYHFDDKTIFKAGVQYDMTPIPSKEARHPALPESDRYMASLGFNYKVNKNLSIDGAYSLLVFADSDSEYRNKCRYNRPEDESGPCTGIGGTFRGKFYDTYANILSLQVNSKY
ncbi:MAG: outer membrane protein transport protein [Pseudomonadota bacterium]